MWDLNLKVSNWRRKCQGDSFHCGDSRGLQLLVWPRLPVSVLGVTLIVGSGPWLLTRPALLQGFGHCSRKISLGVAFHSSQRFFKILSIVFINSFSVLWSRDSFCCLQFRILNKIAPMAFTHVYWKWKTFGLSFLVEAINKFNLTEDV